MKFLLKQIFSFILPMIVLIIIPLNIEKNIHPHNFLALFAGLLLIFSGLYIIILTITKFVSIGKGTLAPWSPTVKLIIDGVYRYVRNPMIIGVLIVLAGESIAVLSFNIFIWTLLFFIINNIWYIFYEEPDLEKKFGDEYRKYKKSVPRWIPRLEPYKTDPDHE